MKIYKFGGASVKDADGVRNLAEIVGRERERLIVVVSAMGKTTDALEALCNRWFYKSGDVQAAFDEIRAYHEAIVAGLFGAGAALPKVEELFGQLRGIVAGEASEAYDFEYDRVISFGELISTAIVTAFLERSITAHWVDVRNCLRSDDDFRKAHIDQQISGELCRKAFTFADTPVYVTQGFIAGTADGRTTTLGREGSDYTAALLANFLNAESVTLWKDVPGVMSADPRIDPSAAILPRLSYRRATEMTVAGAKVIHPKTIKPLEDKQIPLYVKSFYHPDEPGTIIGPNGDLPD